MSKSTASFLPDAKGLSDLGGPMPLMPVTAGQTLVDAKAPRRNRGFAMKSWKADLTLILALSISPYYISVAAKLPGVLPSEAPSDSTPGLGLGRLFSAKNDPCRRYNILRLPTLSCYDSLAVSTEKQYHLSGSMATLLSLSSSHVCRRLSATRPLLCALRAHRSEPE